MADPRAHKSVLPSRSGHIPTLLVESESSAEDDIRAFALAEASRNARGPHPPMSKKKKSVPLPMPQMLLLLVLAVAEPIHATQIYPYLAQLVGEIGVTRGDNGKIGYYSGLIDTAFFFTESCFVLQWARTSDRIGRRPVLLCGVTGISLSAICFGLSRTFPGLVMSRALAGVLNGNFAVLRGAMADILNPSNFARGIAWMPIMWSLGATVGPLMGGSLSHPYERMPSLFGGNVIWKRYPYLLPCMFSASTSITALVLSFFFLEETLPFYKKVSPDDPRGEYQLIDSPSNPAVAAATKVPHQPTLRSLLTPPLIIILINYAIFSLCEVSLNAVLPLFLATPLSLGGLGFTPSMIGICLATIGLLNGCVQVMYFAKIHARWGSKQVLRNGMLAYATIFALFPVVSWLARSGSPTIFVVLTLLLQAMVFPAAMMISSCITILLTDATSPSALGAANGLAQTTASFLRALGPAGATSLLALSVQNNIAGKAFLSVLLFVLMFTGWLLFWTGGCFVFYVEAAVALVGYMTSGWILTEGRREEDRYD